jgi:hypothetical protein
MKLTVWPTILLAVVTTQAIADEKATGINDAGEIASPTSISVGVLSQKGGTKKVFLVDSRSSAFCKRMAFYVQGELRVEKLMDSIQANEFDTEYKIMNGKGGCAVGMSSHGFSTFEGNHEDRVRLEGLLAKLANWKQRGTDLVVSGPKSLLRCLRGDLQLISFSKPRDSEYEIVLLPEACGGGNRLMMPLAGKYEDESSTLKLSTLVYSKDP